MADGLIARVLATPEGATGAGLIALVALGGLAAGWLFPGDPLDMVARPLLQPFASPAFPLGTDRLGRDLAAGLVHGARGSLAIGLAVAIVALVVGAAAGALAGMFGGLVDEITMRVADAIQTVPAFLLALAIVATTGPSLGGVVVALAASAWTGPARVVRAEVLSLKERAFVDASRLAGRSTMSIALRVVLPNALSTAIALGAIIVAGALLSEAALAFLGLGDPNAPSWGAMIAEGRAVIRTAPHVILLPGAALFVTVLAVSLVGEGLQKALTGRRSEGA
jgi:peptide/nickel transport system permease protein